VAVALADRTDLPAFARFHFAGHTLTGQQLLDGIEQAARRLGLGGAAPFKRGTMPWGLIRTLGLVVPMYRELAEMAYLWETPHALDGSAFEAPFGRCATNPAGHGTAGLLARPGAGARLSGQCDTACLTTPEPQVVGVL
jgi:hypothetical protein